MSGEPERLPGRRGDPALDPGDGHLHELAVESLIEPPLEVGPGFERFETLEFCAKTIIKAGLLGEVRYLADAQADRARPVVAAPPMSRAGPVTAAERELRRSPDRKSTRLNSSHLKLSRMPSSA